MELISPTPFAIPSLQPILSPEQRELERLILLRKLSSVFQPIVDLSNGDIVGYEGLIRPPADSSLSTPLALFEAAARLGMSYELDCACRDVTVQRFVELSLPGQLFLNLLPDTVVAGPIQAAELESSSGLAASRMIIELTEHRPNCCYAVLREAAAHWREQGFALALDDLGEGFANLRMWSELRPEWVKLDKYLIQNLANDPVKEQFVRSLLDMARVAGAKLVAEGIETTAELMVLRKIGVRYGQGYLIAPPQPEPPRKLAPSPHFGQLGRRVAPQQPVVRDLAVSVEPMGPEVANEQAYQRFSDTPTCMALPVVDNGLPVGLLRRQDFLERFARPFNRELYGKKPCRLLMDPQPLVVSADLGLLELSHLMVAGERNHLVDGFIITSDGRYLGMGTGLELVRRVTDLQISTARYANPLTGLPGNVPIHETINRLLESGESFVVAYADLDNFKPFNDLYGYSAGDGLILRLAQLLLEEMDPHSDFVGHIGGDDFVVLMQSLDWQARLQRLLLRFDSIVWTHFDASHREAGGFEMVDRNGMVSFFPLTSVSIGVLLVRAGQYHSPYDVALAAADAKKSAKTEPGSQLFIVQPSTVESIV
ncbi:EAL domain-containing protein [Crenobacter oryzisoli]|uniref:EAL domain-containing protein n=1 Tax=Crenobacter oryzisoli TaxID=3056844 RepID=UPI003F49370D